MGWVQTVTTYPATCCAVLSFALAGVCGGFSVLVAPFINDTERSKRAMENGAQAAGAFLVFGIILLIGVGKYRG